MGAFGRLDLLDRPGFSSRASGCFSWDLGNVDPRHPASAVAGSWSLEWPALSVLCAGAGP
jgi:hypothetical protein